MDNTNEKETHDFMNVDSFSQLPFIRPPPPTKEKAIRLFGIEFADAPTAADESESTDTTTTTTNNNNNNALELDSNNSKENNTENGESSRRFECHYCCRNFPTSQALGGHQNAHKRERQHKKRAQIQSAMQVHSTLSDDRVYGLMNYRFGSAPTWNSNSSSSAMIRGGMFYGSNINGHGSSYSYQQQQPINGSPLPLWRVTTATTGNVQSNPIFNREPSLHPLPLFSGEEVNTRMGPTRVGTSSSQNRYAGYDSKPSVNDHVSLDLHL